MGEELKPVVECYSSSAYAERPVALQWEGERVEIIDIEERWRLPNGVGFQVAAGDGRRFRLFYDELNDIWDINEV